MEFDDFFNHAFIRKLPAPQNSPPLATPAAASAVRPSTSPAKSAAIAVPVTRPVVAQNNNAPIVEEADDFVLVPRPSLQRTASAAANGNEPISSTQPIPVPSQRGAFLKVIFID